MAFVDRPTASLSYSLIDETGSKSTFNLDCPSSTLADAALTAAAALVPLVRAATGCTVLSYNLTYGSRDVTPPPADSGSRVERKGTFQFLTGAGKVVTYNLPSIIPGAVLPDGRIDDDNLAVAALAGALIAADAIFTDSNGEDLTSLYAAYEKFRGTTKTQLPSARRPD